MEIQKFALSQDGFIGRLYIPDDDRFPGKAFLIVGGGDGRYSITKAVAAHFAEAGLTALALAYVKTRNCVKRCLLESVKRRTIYFHPGYEHVYDHPAAEAAIPVERCSGPVLLLAAGQDDMWESCRACENILKNLRNKGFPYPVQDEHYPFGSHMLLPVRTAFSNFFRMEREHPEEYRQSCQDSFEQTLHFIANWQ